jgi:hypothetical protein
LEIWIAVGTRITERPPAQNQTYSFPASGFHRTRNYGDSAFNF